MGYVDYEALKKLKARLDATFASQAKLDALAGDVDKVKESISTPPAITIVGPSVVYVDSDTNMSVETFEFSFVPTSYYVNVDLISVTIYNSAGIVSSDITSVNVVNGGFRLQVAGSDNLDTSYTIVAKFKIGSTTKEVSKSIRIGNFIAAGQHEFVDLGLPSGLLWATCNIGAISPYSYAFMAFMWGETEGNQIGETQTGTNGRIYDDEHYEFKDINASFSPTSGYDAARAKWGGAWRMPTRLEFQELYDNCTNKWTTINGIAGRLFTSKINGKTIFFPACGYCGGASRNDSGSGGYYWSSSWGSSSLAYSLYFNSSSIYPQNGSIGRYRGRAVRAVL